MSRIKHALIILACLLTLGVSMQAKTPKLPKGCTVYGTVTCDGKPMKDVVVSDGYIVTLTDAKGRYFLESDKVDGSVFVSIPSCTEVPLEYGMPHFWEPLGYTDEPEEHNFTLTSVDNNRHAIVAFSDLHLANIYDDQAQLEEGFLPRLYEQIEKYRSHGIAVYCLNGGDSSYDRYWYENLYSIADFPKTLKDNNFPVPMFCAMGNHDNDGATPYSTDTDFEASTLYRNVMGPTHYSFNLGQVHYVVLDNIVYKNSPGRIDSYEGIAGKRDYDVYVTAEQMEWLRADLAAVADKTTPVVVTMHSPVLYYKGDEILTKFRIDGVMNEDLCRDFTSAFKDFSQVHFVTGHVHKNLPCHGEDDTSRFPDITNIIDHNITSACGCWWQTHARGGLALAPDGAPAGFEVFPVDGKDIKWYFVSNDDGEDEQFRVFDMNGVRDYYKANGEMKAFLKHNPKRTDYADIEDNMVYINVWAWEKGWTISVKENGQPLEVVQKPTENPQFTVSYHLPRSSWDDNGITDRWSEKFNVAQKTHNFFRVKASAPDTDLEVTVTDCFGRSWTKIVERPKVFSKTMR
ncbi:MAG: calcineurin-like phosphoesterase family protein [Bacteroidales bacterium]|nr:calcineurin-like phosphoesterase family protein [Bacteroidales bacterium]